MHCLFGGNVCCKQSCFWLFDFDKTWPQWSASVGIRIFTEEKPDHSGGWGWDQMVSNNAKYSNHFSSDSAGQILKEFGRNVMPLNFKVHVFMAINVNA